MVKKQAIGLVLVVASGYPGISHALSLGDIQLSSHVNEPFKARIELLQATQQELTKLQVHVAPPSIFAQAQLERPRFFDHLKFARSVRNGKNYLVITSSQPIAESEFNLLLEVTSPKGELLKRYAVDLAAANSVTGAESGLTKLQLAPRQDRVEPVVGLTPAPHLVDVSLNTDQATVTVAQVSQPEVAPPTLAQSPQDKMRPAKVKPAVPKVAIALPKLVFKHRYRVRKTDTIFTIAERLNIAQLQVDEKVLALYARNPKAFVNGDLNKLKVGAVLKTPTAVGGKRRVAEPAPVQLTRHTLSNERSAQPAKPKALAAPLATAVLPHVPV